MPTRIPTAEELAEFQAAAGIGDAVVHLRRLDAPAEAVANDDGRTLYPASMIKTPLAVALELAVAAGRLRHEDRVEVDARNLTPNDKPSPFVPGYVATLDELERLMLTRSDNVATNVLIDVVGREAATAALARLGLPGTAIRRKLSGALPLIDDPEATGRNTHPAAEAADLFARIASGDVPGAARLRTILAAQEWNEKLPAGLAPGDRFAHKTGDTDEVTHDGGILETNEGLTYVIVVYTGMPSSEANDQRLGAFMRRLRPRLAPLSPE